MTNPVSQIPSAQLPQIDDVISSTDGTPTLLFHRFITGIWQRTGGAAGVNNSDVATVAQDALTIGNAASTAAQAATNTATAAQTSANNALTLAQSALTQANIATNTASAAAGGALLRSNNLSDLNSANAARINIGLSVFPVTVSFDTCPASLKRGIPIARAMQLPTNLAGTTAWWGVPATGTVTFVVGKSRGPSSAVTSIGSIQVGAGTGINLSIQAAVSFAVGDCLVVTCPASPDATLAEVAFTFPMILT